MKLFDAFSEDREENLQLIKEKVTKGAMNTAIFIIASIMIVYGINNLYTIVFIQSDESWVNTVNTVIQIIGVLVNQDFPTIHLSRFLRVPGTLLFIICGILLFLDVRRNFLRAIGLYALCMGVSRIITCLPLLLSAEDTTNGVGWFVFILGVNLCYSGYSLLSGAVRGKYGMFAAAVIFSGFYMILIGFMAYFELVLMEGSMVDYLANMYPLLIPFAMYFILLWLIDTDEIRYNDRISRHIRILNGIDATYRTIENLTFTDAEARSLASPGSEGWTVFDHDNGPVEMEMRTVISAPYGTGYLTVQRWYGSDTLYLTVSSSEKGTLLYAYRLQADRVEYTEGSGELFLLGQHDMLRAKVVSGEGSA